ncbi:hypothetical protein BC332_28494 [Capsicum chinense]|nr:hypothetical protein BC332_28494 [Capsicum chinense]
MICSCLGMEIGCNLRDLQLEVGSEYFVLSVFFSLSLWCWIDMEQLQLTEDMTLDRKLWRRRIRVEDLTFAIMYSLIKMANPHNVELEAAKFLHKLIQESKDEPTKLATKLYVILQHMRSSGKENSMPYQVISRAMETVVKQHGLDIEALMSARLPMSAAAQVGEAASSLVAGSSQRPGITRDSKANLLGNEMVKPDAYASSSAVSGPSGSGHGIYQASAPHISGTGAKVPVMAPSASNSSQLVEPGISSQMQFGSPSIDNHGYAAKLHKGGSTEPLSGSTSVDLVAGRTAAGRAVEQEGGSQRKTDEVSVQIQEHLENTWLKVDDFNDRDRVVGWWSNYAVKGRPSFRLDKKLKLLKKNLREWNKEVFGRVEVKMMEIMIEVGDLERLQILGGEGLEVREKERKMGLEKELEEMALAQNIS